MIELLHVFFSLSIGGLHVLPRLTLDYLFIVICKQVCCIIGLGMVYSAKTGLWGLKQFPYIFHLTCDVWGKPRTKSYYICNYLVLQFISLYYCQYSYKSIISCPASQQTKYVLSKREFISLYLLFSVWKTKITHQHFPIDFKKQI